MDAEYPVLKGPVRGDQIIVFCPYCNKWHQHGWDGSKSHKTAHCQDSPFCKTGYYVDSFTESEYHAFSRKDD